MTCPISDTFPNTVLKLFKYGWTKKNQISNPMTPAAEAKEQLQQIVDIVTFYQCNRPITTLSHESSELPPTQYLRPIPDIKNIEMYIFFMEYIVPLYHKGYNRLDLIYDCYQEISNK